MRLMQSNGHRSGIPFANGRLKPSVRQVDKQYEIDHIVRHELLGEGSALASVTTHGDFFSYLLSDFDGSGFDDATWPFFTLSFFTLSSWVACPHTFECPGS